MNVTLTATLETLISGRRPPRAELLITAPAVKDVDGKIIHSGGTRAIDFTRGKISVDLLATNTPNTDPVTWLYKFQVRYSGGELPAFTTELTSDSDLAALQPMDPASPQYQPQTISMDRVAGLDEALEDFATEFTSVHADVDVVTDALGTKADKATTYTKIESDKRHLKAESATVIDLGNSIASNGVLCYYDRITSGSLAFGYNSYMAWAMPKTGGRFRCMGVGAIGGYTMEQITAELLSPAIAASPDYIHLQVFTNNVNLIVAGTQTLSEAQALYMGIVNAIVDAGITPIIATMPPLNAQSTGTGLTLMTKINLWLHSVAKANGFPFVDYYAPLVDPATNQFLTGYSVDGVHMAGPGARAMGDALAATLNALPSTSKPPLWGSYNPNFMQPDVCFNSAGADKWYGSGTTTGGWAIKTVAGPMWKGNSPILTRGSNGDFSEVGPVTSALWVAGNRVRWAFQFDASLVPTGGKWTVVLYDQTTFRNLAGFIDMDAPLTHKSVTAVGGTTTNGSNVVSAAAGTFKPEHVGCGITATGTTGLLQAFPANTVVRGVSADGTQAYASANATDTRTGISVITISGPQCVGVFEFDVQADWVGHSIVPFFSVKTVAGTTLNISQHTLVDVTALGVSA